MNELNKKKRTSILKKRASTVEEDDPTEITVSKFPKKTQFSQKKQIKEFLPCEENVTIWGNTYETSVAKSEGSSDGSSTSRKISVDFSHTTINGANATTTSVIESEKENILVERLAVRPSDENSNISSNSSSARNSVEMTIEMNNSERRRVNKYGTDNLNITNIPLDASLVTNKLLNIPDTKPKKVLSPRKMIFIHKSSNLSVTIKDKVLMDPSKFEDNVSISLEEDENIEKIKRKTMNQPVDMNISVKPPHNKTINFEPSTSKVQTSLSKFTPTVFKIPEMPKTFNFQPQCFESPPIKPAALENQKEELDEMFEMMVSDTPSKNLCCLGKAHTPVRSSAQKVVFSAFRPTSLRKSTDIFKDIGLIDDDDDEDEKFKKAKRTIFHNDSIKLDHNSTKEEHRKTTFDKIKMDETTELSQKTQHNFSDLDISTTTEDDGQKIADTECKGNDIIDETCLNKSKAQYKIFLDETDPSIVARNIQQMSFKSCEFDIKEKLSTKRSTLSNDTCNATNFIMEMTYKDDTGGTLESTAEIQRKAEKLLENPHAYLGSSNNIDSPMPENITDNFILKDLSRVGKSLNLEPSPTISGLQKSLPYDKNRSTVYFENNMDISGIEPTSEIPKLSEIKPLKSNSERLLNKKRATTYNSNNMDVSIDDTKRATGTSNFILKDLSKADKSVILEPSPTISGLQKSSIYGKNRPTVYFENNMDISGIEPTSEIPKLTKVKPIESNSERTTSPLNKKRATTYNINNMDVSIDDTKRATIHNVNNMDVSGLKAKIFEDLSKTDKPLSLEPSPTISALQKSLPCGKSRPTVYFENNMDISGVESTSEIPKSIESKHVKLNNEFKNRPTVYFENKIMDISRIESTSEIQKVTEINPEESNNEFATTSGFNKKRATTYNINNMDVSIDDTKRTTTYNANNMDVSGSKSSRSSNFILKDLSKADKTLNLEPSPTISGLQNNLPYGKNRPTVYFENNMDISGIEPTSEIPKLTEIKSVKSNSERTTSPLNKKRATTYNSNNMDVSSDDTKRTTFHNVNNMDVSGIKASGTSNFILKDLSQVDESLILESSPTISGVQKSSIYGINRPTVYYENYMDVSRIDSTSEIPKLSEVKPVKSNNERTTSPFNKKRVTTYNLNNMDVSIDDTKRTTVHNVNNMDVSGLKASGTSNLILKDILKADKTLYLEPNPKISGLQKNLPYGKNRPTVYYENNMDISGIEPSSEITKLNEIKSLKSNNEFATASPLHKKRITTYNSNNMDVSIDTKRTTIHNVNNMDVSISEASGSSRRKTFTIAKKNESLRWHNMTDTDLNMIDDESDPCNDISLSSPSTINDPNNISRYEEALEDFMNLTVKASPLNQPMPAVSNLKLRRQSRIPSPARDYDTMFEDFIDNLSNSGRPKPRLEIDEFLEKMKVEPIKIPRYEQCQEGYLSRKFNELITNHKNRQDERRKFKKDIETSQFPQIPSAKFLMKNLIECMEEEILKSVKQKQNAIPPIFPEAIDFERLLINKFKTDEFLSKYWVLDSFFWHKRNFKLMHKKMPMFTLNFTCQQCMAEADDSTIPIIFRNVILYLTPEFRTEFSTTKKNTLLRREFYRVINGVDNFTSVCHSTDDLFEFLNYYHTNVMKALNEVENFYKIVTKYKAVFRTHPRFNYDIIHKRIFQKDDLVDIEICIDCYLEDVPINNLSIKGRNFNYILSSNFNGNGLKGLMLIELILFDTEKLLSTHVQRIKIED